MLLTFSELAHRAKDPETCGCSDQRRHEGGPRAMGVQGGVRGGGSRRLQRERRRQRVVQEKLQKHQRQGQTPVSAKTVSHLRVAGIQGAA